MKKFQEGQIVAVTLPVQIRGRVTSCGDAYVAVKDDVSGLTLSGVSISRVSSVLPDYRPGDWLVSCQNSISAFLVVGPNKMCGYTAGHSTLECEIAAYAHLMSFAPAHRIAMARGEV